ncbi:hypothetical protein NQ317_006003 [Molorchus minor]|uniref:Uncharacterized protein n=1 Tax=Molorchus minor TaxID=1323400 RepID=A0ABQ9J2L9_9CUCU|nr:hypothetical protein NQ317_006003 [Molorchus minor]
MKNKLSTQSKQSRTSKQSKRLSQTFKRSSKSVGLLGDEFAEGVVVIPPDGGWGWVIVVMAFLCNFIIDGVIYTFGLFLEEISESFNESPTKIALVNSIMSGFYFIVGPITCALTNKYGFRMIAAIGSVIAAVAFFLSTIIDNIIAFFILIGVLCGIGFNMMYIPSLLVVGFYFERWRGLATCLAVCGSSLGVLTFPPVVTTVLKSMNWKWKFIVLSAITFSTILCALSYRPLQPVVMSDNIKRNNFFDDTDTIESLNMESNRGQSNVKNIFQQYHNTAYPTVNDRRQDSNTVLNLSRITEDSSTFLEIFPSGVSSATGYQADGLSSIYENRSKTCCSIEGCKKMFCCCCYKKCGKRSRLEIPNRPMYRDDIFYRGSLFLLPEYNKSRTTVISVGPSKISSANYHMSVTRVATIRDIEQHRRCICCPEAVIRIMATMLDVRLLKTTSFLLLALNGFVTNIGIYSPFIFLIQRSEEMNIDEEWGSLLLTFVGAANLVGRILCGVAASFPQTDALLLNIVSTFILAGVTILSNYLYSLEGQIACAILFGLNIETEISVDYIK